MTDAFTERIRLLMRRFYMTEPGDRVLVGVSGGADSVCLLTVLCLFAPSEKIVLRAVHVHHGLRDSADRDEKYVRQLCARYGVPLETIHVDAAGYASAHGMGIEESARILRYEAFESACRSWEREEDGRPCKIAVAHHMDDQVETVLFHLCRGSSVAGLGGMLPVNGRVIRPLLCVRRREIEAWLREQKIPWQTDETNADTRYARNRIRSEVMPLLEKVHAGAAEHIADTAGDAAEVEEYLREQTQAALLRCEVQDGAVSVPALMKENPFIRKRVLFSALSRAAGHRKDLARVHVGALLDLCGGTGSASLDLPYGVRAVRRYDRLYFTKPGPDTRRYPLDGSEYVMRVIEFSGDMASIPAKKYTKWLDYDKMTTFPVLRTRRAGDRIALSDRASKSIARCMIDRKVPADIREKIILPILEPGQVLWIPGYRISAAFKVSETTRQVLEISWHAAGSDRALQ